MKRKIIALGAILLMSLSVVPGRAQSNAEQGLLGGAIGGALLGQAIGRDTEATLIGTAVGGMLGLMVGSNYDRATTVRYSRVVDPPRHRAIEPVCREAEVLAYVDGRPERIWTTVCQEHGEWVVPETPTSYQRTVIIDRDCGGYPPGWAKYRPFRNKWQRPVAARCGTRANRNWNGVNVIIR